MLTLALALAGAAGAALADAGTEKETQGMRLFQQSCRVCHTETLAGVAPYGPLLWAGSAGGNALALTVIIGEGTARMPAWKYRFTKAEIESIAAYIASIKQQPQLAKDSGMKAFTGGIGDK